MSVEAGEMRLAMGWERKLAAVGGVGGKGLVLHR